MDVPRTRAKPRTRRIVILAAGVLVLVAVTVGLRVLGNRMPSVSRSQLWIGTVQRGPLALGIHGTGTLVPTDFRWASAPVAARVEKVLVQPGAQVQADTALLELANPDAQLAALQADRDVAVAETELARLGAQLDGTRLAQESAVAGLDADASIAKRRATIDDAMAKKGVIADLESAESTDRAAQLASRLVFEKQRLAALKRGNVAQLAAQKQQVEQLRALADFHKQQLDALHVRAGQAGVVQQVAVEAGQTVAVGAPLAKIDTRNGIVPGEVERIDPAAQNGSVIVDVKLTAPPPKGARVDQNVDGDIELAHTGDVLHVPRPAIGEAHQTTTLFKLDGDGVAHRVTVKFGRAALKDIEIASGLAEGDRVVLSDMSKWDGYDRLGIE